MTTPNTAPNSIPNSIYDFKVKTISGQESPLSHYKGKVLLIVNVASKCGFTPQYQGLESMYEKYKNQGFAVLGFPCNQFGSQEPGSDQDIQNFCTLNFSVKFPLFSKVEVNGANAHPLYQFLKSEKPGFLGSKGIKWNFTKFLINSNGQVLKRFAPTVKPSQIEEEIKPLLNK